MPEKNPYITWSLGRLTRSAIKNEQELEVMIRSCAGYARQNVEIIKRDLTLMYEALDQIHHQLIGKYSSRKS